MADSRTFVIVGGGLAAEKAVEGLRDSGFDGRVVLVGEEHHLPYERPPLSKGFLLGDEQLASVFPQPPEWYDEQHIDLRLGTAVTSVDLDGHAVVTGNERIGYDRLLLATGASPRRLPVADDSGAPVAYLRTIEDSERIYAAWLHRKPSVHDIALTGGTEPSLHHVGFFADEVVVEPRHGEPAFDERPLHGTDLILLNDDVGLKLAQVGRFQATRRLGKTIVRINTIEATSPLATGEHFDESSLPTALVPSEPDAPDAAYE